MSTARTAVSLFMPPRVARWVAVALGVVTALVAIGVAALITAVFGTVAYAPLIGGVAVAVWFGGGSSALVSMVVGWGVGDFVLTHPRGELGFASGDDFARWVTTLAIAVLVTLIGLTYRRGQHEALKAVREAERSQARMQTLQELAGSLSAALTREDVARVLVQRVPPTIGAHGAALGLLEGDELVVVDPEGAVGQTIPPGTRFSLATRAPIVAAARSGETIWVGQRRDFATRFPDGAELAPYASSVIAVPVLAGGRVVGAMGLPFDAPDAVTDEVRAVATLAAELGGQALERAGLYEQERISRQGLDEILAVAPRFQQATTPDEVAQSVTFEALRAFGCDAAQVWTPVDDTGLVVTWREPPSTVLPPGLRIEFSDFPGLLPEMTALRAMFVADAQAHVGGGALNHARQLGIHSSLRVPIVIGGRFERILTLQWSRVVPEPAPAVMALIRRFADQAGLAIEQAERRRAERETRQLQAVTSALAVAATAGEVAAAIVRQSRLALEGSGGATLYLVTPDGASAELVAQEGFSDAHAERWRTIPLGTSSPPTDAIRDRAVIACETLEAIEERFPLLQPEGKAFVAVPLLLADRAVGAVLIGSSKPRRYDVGELGLVLGIAQQAAQALERARLFDLERRSAARMRALQRVTAALSRAVTVDEVSRTCLDQGAEALGAAAGVVALRKPDSDALEIVYALGYDEPALGAWRRIPVTADVPLAEVARTGTPMWATDGDSLAPGGWVSLAGETERRFITLPLGTGGTSAGVLHFGFVGVPELTQEDRDWILTLASQCSQALDRAGRYEAERMISETLQRSVLPERLPTVEGVGIAARYLPGTAGVDVGGDWYDAIELDGGALGLVVGDVVGKGVRAAATMGQLRNALRAFGFEHPEPADAVVRLNRLVDGLTDSFATLAYVVVDPATLDARYVVAGHPPPLVLRPEGSAAFLDGGRALPLGVDVDATLTAAEVCFEPGSILLIYTDGLVERRGRSLDAGLDQLRQIVSGYTGADVDELADLVLDGMLEDERGDDVALMAIRLDGALAPGFRRTLDSSPTGLIEMRAALREWLAGIEVPTLAAEEIVLAVWEAGANAIEHAQRPARPTFRISGAVMPAGRIRLVVADSGAWKQSNGSENRGMGISLMRSLMDSVEVTRGAAGTVVVLERRIRAAARV